jgi:hypothetical protein
MPFDRDGDERAVDQQALDPPARLRCSAHRIGHHRADQDRIGAGSDRGIDVVDLAALIVRRAVRQLQPDLDRVQPALPLIPFERRSVSSRTATGKVTYIGS